MGQRVGLQRRIDLSQCGASLDAEERWRSHVCSFQELESWPELEVWYHWYEEIHACFFLVNVRQPVADVWCDSR